MTIPTHLLAGLIIGKLTGNYPAAIIGSVIVDFDHIISYFRHDIIFKPRLLYQAFTNIEDPWGDQRNFAHSFICWAGVAILFHVTRLRFGVTFSLAYFIHLVFDVLDKSEFYPLFPSKKIVIPGIIKYNSWQEIAFTIPLLIILIYLHLS